MEDQARKKVSFQPNGSDGDGPPVKFSVSSRKQSEVAPSNLLLVELFEYRANVEEHEWLQTARWIKYEEDVEPVDQTWARPKLPLIPYHSVKQLIEFIEGGVILLDVEAYNFGDIASCMIRALVDRYEISEEDAGRFITALRTGFKRPVESGKKYSLTTSGASRKLTTSIIADDQRSDSKISRASSAAYRMQMSTPTISEIGPDGSPLEPSSGTDPQTIRPAGPLFLSVQSTGPSAGPMSLKKKISQISRKVSRIIPPKFLFLDENAEAVQVFVGVFAEIGETIFVMIRLRTPVFMPECQSTIPIRFMFLIAGPISRDTDYRDLGRTISTLMSNQIFRETAYEASDRDPLIGSLREFLDSSVLIPPVEIQTKDLINVDDVRKALKRRRMQKEEARTQTDGDGLIGDSAGKPAEPAETSAKSIDESSAPPAGRQPWERTGKPFGGLVQDVKNRLPLYLSDFKDALHPQCISATIFMFFVAFAPALAFGQVMNQRLDGYMGITEVFVAHFLCGIAWALFAGQPFLIQGATGPLMIFESALFEFCKSNGLEFLVIRVWVSLWTFLLSVLMVLVEAPFLVGYVTRFTQDVFTTLVAGIFVYEAAKFVVKNFIAHPVIATLDYCTFNETTFPINQTTPTVHQAQANTALLSMMFVIGTFVLADMFKRIRAGHLFGRTARKLLGDFGMPMAILFMVGLYHVAFRGTFLHMADMPSGFGLTSPEKRPWFVHPMGIDSRMPTWVVFAAIIPGFLISILMFAVTENLELLLHGKDFGLQKPMGFHWDLPLGAGLLFMCGLLGLPWMSGAAVQSLTHTRSLTIMKRTAPGEKPAVEYVVEQRVTNILISILIGVCSFLGTILSAIPIAVLFGIFLYLGVTSLMSIQFINRLSLLLLPRKYFPDQPYCKDVSSWRMHLFSAIQALVFIILWVVNMIPQSSLAFPFVIAISALIRRFVLARIFKPFELHALDPSDMDKMPETEDELHEDMNYIAVPK